MSSEARRNAIGDWSLRHFPNPEQGDTMPGAREGLGTARKAWPGCGLHPPQREGSPSALMNASTVDRLKWWVGWVHAGKVGMSTHRMQSSSSRGVRLPQRDASANSETMLG